MVRDRDGGRGSGARRVSFDLVGHTEVQPLAARKAQLAEQRLAELLVHERVLRLPVAGHLVDKAKRLGLLKGIEDLVLGGSADGQQQ